ncbi:L-sorbosone dehydrogenase-like protein [Cladobotryum mycophilum]|uniref:L-sorbosone dehydrogenase-like protein n=1 Tax=Cladobotryum mycophilum TaxID=491253 RepID=A0ABR0T2N0_9HYPO
MAPTMQLLLGAIGLLASQASAACAGLKTASSPVTAPGIQYKVIANGLGSPRSVVIDTLGNLLIAQTKPGAIQRLVLDKGEGLDVCVQSTTKLVSNSFTHSLALSQDGKTLFATTSNVAIAYPYDAAKGTLGAGKTIITGMDNTDHVSRTLLIPPHNPNLLVIARGSNDNIDNGTMQVESGRSQIRIFKIDQLLKNPNPVQYTTGDVLGWGLRNSVGVAQHPKTGHVWSVENSMDEVHRGGVDIHNSNPGEELNFHGLLTDTTSAYYGKNYGYPRCIAIFDPSNIQNYPGGAAVGKQMTADHTIQGVTDDWCIKNTVSPRITFESHLAPLDIKFRDDGLQAFVSIHGSWNRQPPSGYRLSRVNFGADGFPVEPQSSTKAEVKLMWNSDNSKCPGACFRPVGLALDEKRSTKRMFMTSDNSGELFVLTGLHNK